MFIDGVNYDEIAAERREWERDGLAEAERADQACPARMKIGPRFPFPAAEGVTGWYREINGTFYRFTAVIDGWWGVGPTGTIRVSRPIGNGDYYPVHTIAPADEHADTA